MANTVKLKRSAVQGKEPTTSDLSLGEVAINTYDGKVFIKKDQGGTESIVEVGSSESDILTTARVLNEDYTLASGRNMLSINDVETSSGTTVEVPAGSTWVVVA